MSDPATVLRPALKTWLTADTAVIAAFGSNPVRVFKKTPPVNQHPLYVELLGIDVDDDLAECLDATEVTLTTYVTSLTSPPGFEEAEAMCAAVKASYARLETDIGNSPQFTIAGFRVRGVQSRSACFQDATGKSVQGIVTTNLWIDPV